MADGDVLLFRHATAPGTGDPPGFKLGECRTQRNLDEAGREQARRIGQALRERRVKVGAVWSSPWCRTLETAALALPDQRALEVAAFGSFFEDRSSQARYVKEARDRLAQWKGPGTLVVFTHQVNITALAEVFPSSGEGVLLRRRDGAWAVAGRLPPP